jgi:hypothetical protein
MDPDLRSELIARYMLEQSNREAAVSHLIANDDVFLDSGNARVENYPGRRRPVHPHEDFMGYIVATNKLLIYKDDFGEIVIPFRDIKKLKCEPFPLEATNGLSIELDQMYAYFSAQESFAHGLAQAFKQGMWHEERKQNPKSKGIIQRVLFRK